MTKILLVEDDKSLREIYGVRLQAEGYEIVSAGDGEEALAVAIKERPALIVSDVMMPKISGFDMLDILRSTTETKDVKVIMMTALSSEDQRARGEALGADRYLVKSQVGIEDVVRTVHDVLGDGIPAPAAAPAFPPVSTPSPVSTPAPVASSPAPAPAPAEPLPTISLPPTPEAAPAPAVSEPVLPPTPAPTPVAPAEPPVINMPAPEAPVAPSAPVEPSVPVAPAPAPTAPAVPAAPAAPEVALPAPTAPFSTPRPASLGDRVINPLPSADNLSSPAGDLAAQMNQELNSLNTPPQPPTPPVPPAPSA